MPANASDSRSRSRDGIRRRASLKRWPLAKHFGRATSTGHVIDVGHTSDQQLIRLIRSKRVCQQEIEYLLRKIAGRQLPCAARGPLRACGRAPDSRLPGGWDVKQLFRMMARPLESEEREAAKHAYDAFLRYYGANSEEAARLLATGESESDQELPAVESAALTYDRQSIVESG